VKQIGFWSAVALVMGNMIGSGVYLLPASLASFGGMSLAGWLVSAAGSAMIALVFARLARIAPAAGGPYAFTRQGFGDLPGFLVAWGYWISVWCGDAALAVAIVGYLGPFFPSLTTTPALAAIVAVAFVWLLTIVNLRGVATASRVQIITTGLKILPLLLIGAVGLTVLHPEHFATTVTDVPSFGRQLASVMALTMWAFLGLESATVPADSVRDPDRTIPRATIAGVAFAAVIYIVSTAGVMAVVPPDVLAKTTAPFAEAARMLFGDVAGRVVAIFAAISAFGALNGWILVVGQLPRAVARDRLFPSVFGRTNAAGAPAPALLIGAVLTTLLIATNFSQSLVGLFTFFILLATLSTLVPYAFCAMASFLIPERDGRRLSTGAAVIAAIAFGYALFVIGGAGADTVYWGFILLLAGLPVYVWLRRQPADAER
jgi:APA family basic amino acid/polyamine antiporter